MREEYAHRWEQAEIAREELAKTCARQKKARLDGEETMGDSENNLEGVPKMMANLSMVALDGMDPDNSKELEKNIIKNRQQAERQWAKRYMREKLCKIMATGSGARKHQSNVKWAHRYLPQNLPPGITLCTFNRPPHRGNWVARYDGDHNPPLKYDKAYDQMTFSRSFDRVN